MIVRNHIVRRVLKVGTMSMVLIFSSLSARSQQDVFQMFRDEVSRGDQYYRQGSYRHALKEYLLQGKDATIATELKIARCLYFTHDYRQSADRFRRASAIKTLDESDVLLMAEALAASGNYGDAIVQYQEYLKKSPDDDLVRSKIWRLKNVHFLYEDSLHFSLRKLPLSSGYSDFAAVPLNNGVVFLSNRKGASTLDQSDALTGDHFFRLYFSPFVDGAGISAFSTYGKIAPFKGLETQRQNGPVAFFSDETRVAFTRTKSGRNTRGTLQLFFAHQNTHGWNEENAFSYNSEDYNITTPWVSEDGSTLFFASDMKGGYGGTDIYKSTFENGKWSKPVNLGPEINTRFDESFPHFYQTQFYFSSNGHAGMGGLDIFKAPVLETGFGEVSNPGYPVNSFADDFGFFLRREGHSAYLSSNREGSDDLYEVEIDLQSYPVQISGVLKSRSFSVTDSAIIELLPNTRMYLVDHNRDIVIEEFVTDDQGFFQFKIPYFSQYKIKVRDASGTESVVSLDIPRQKKSDYTHEIVVVKDAFHTPQE